MTRISRARVALAGACTLAPSFLAASPCAGASGAPMPSSFNGARHRWAPTSVADPRLGQPPFHRDEGDDAGASHATTPAGR